MDRRAFVTGHQILKGAKASDLPIDRPVLLDFALNLRSAKALGLIIPPSLLLRVDQVIEQCGMKGASPCSDN